jgi:hypothetical protein
MQVLTKEQLREQLVTARNINKQLKHELSKFDECVAMPKELTAENGGKYIFMGEFKETIEIQCPECYDLDDDDECEECEGTLDVTIGWDTIKSIYALAVKKMALSNSRDK